MPIERILPTTLLVFLLSTSLASADDSPPKAGPDAKLATILKDWHRRSSSWKNLEVRFAGRDDSPIVKPLVAGWFDYFFGEPGFPRNENDTFIGRVVFHKGGRALIETRGINERGQVYSSSIMIWTDGAVHLADSQSKQPIRGIRDEQDRDRLPAILALPFLWHTSVETLTSRYRVELLKETDRSWVLRITPLNPTAPHGFSKIWLELDKVTYLPRNYRVVNIDVRSSRLYRVTKSWTNPRVSVQDVKLFDDNKVTPIEIEQANRPNRLVRAIEIAGGKPPEWLVRPFKIEMLP